ncbi:LCP family protein [soil metagenome]
MTTDPASTPVSTRPLAPKGRWWRRVVIGVLLLANLGVGLVLFAVQSGQSAFNENVTQNTDVTPELDARPTENTEPITFLVIGSDTREGLESLQNFGESNGARGDVIMLIKLNPANGSAQILSLPRDLLVDIPGHGTDRINAAYSFGGAPLMVRTVRAATGLPIHHYVEIDFVGFQALVNEIGGVHLDFPYPARDLNSGLDVEAGNQLLDGAQALAFARSRRYEELQGDSWVNIDADDFGRTRRQQRLILAILSELKTPSSLTEAGSIVASFAQHLTVDSALAESSLVQLAFQMRGISSQTMETATLPGYITDFEGKSVVRMSHPEADRMIVAFAEGKLLDLSSQEVLRLEVLNGNGVEGAAGRMSDLLEEKGFEVASIGEADSYDFETTTIIVRPEALASAQALVDLLGFGTVSTGSLIDGIDAIVIVGLDADRSLQSG